MAHHTINTVHVLVGTTKVAVRGVTHDDSATPEHRALMLDLDVIDDDMSAIWSEDALQALVASKLNVNGADVSFAVPRVA
jgi:hypothetical protein